MWRLAVADGGWFRWRLSQEGVRFGALEPGAGGWGRALRAEERAVKAKALAERLIGAELKQQ